ncbi:MAG: hypothetical protein HYX61_11340 [Gammaproteobacteria bacterium]|jgi:hypothetical protein|nr:hypothetical protein [Gammaproteobacteria bacterium]
MSWLICYIQIKGNKHDLLGISVFTSIHLNVVNDNIIAQIKAKYAVNFNSSKLLIYHYNFLFTSLGPDMFSINNTPSVKLSPPASPSMSMSSLNRSLMDCIKDDNGEKVLISRATDNKENVLKSPPTFTLMFDAKTTRAICPVGEKEYQFTLHKYGKEHFYHLVKLSDNLYQLKSNINDKTQAPNGNYAFVVLCNTDGKLELRIGNKKHYYLSGKTYGNVIAAGEITFSKTADGHAATIDIINDKSGGYHICETDSPLLRAKKISNRRALVKVGLPLNKFVQFTEKSEEHSNMLKRRASV